MIFKNVRDYLMVDFSFNVPEAPSVVIIIIFAFSSWMQVHTFSLTKGILGISGVHNFWEVHTIKQHLWFDLDLKPLLHTFPLILISRNSRELIYGASPEMPEALRHSDKVVALFPFPASKKMFSFQHREALRHCCVWCKWRGMSWLFLFHLLFQIMAHIQKKWSYSKLQKYIQQIDVSLGFQIRFHVLTDAS